ncbi:MAG: hypothetical protein IPJ74_05305 [Saprospiraceae bacterium]|nr:hypothetical protein [Saprospiraceae bacterium]
MERSKSVEVDIKLLNIGTESETGGKGIGRFASLQLGKDINIETVGYDDSLKIYPLNNSNKVRVFSNGKKYCRN